MESILPSYPQSALSHAKDCTAVGAAQGLYLEFFVSQKPETTHLENVARPAPTNQVNHSQTVYAITLRQLEHIQ
ncbi:hypothetical protein RvY_05374 [Ramazzottius varieornatus]|uniref:Uncharacterized protein n=1 Tax=Ramazzottius varieornatus TaxID=947166 RepID=A0A1D1V0G9_RAMVA|nr:hypothetical protein RvY_05374 [Ramazzottius varieornatus]